MNESLASACSEFEQFLLAGMLRSAGFGRPIEMDGGTEPGSAFASSGESEAVAQLFVQALAGALERAGGIGVARGLQSALGKVRK
jgi:hypothetical protein